MRKANLARLLARGVDGIHLAPFEQGAGPANVVSLNAQFAANVKEQQASYGMFDHVALQSVLATLALALQETHD